ncbi:hypothetical protein GCM10017781_32310 [Deinococcus metalli]|uniref:Uncharacterized protein n=1 Tax=Deinococcus metalli TaxID=1141878 RepID=A0ABQ3JS38_9DEIO|nr:hypothetical protein GCM10017781_32310 [Deinococcus metalli]
METLELTLRYGEAGEHRQVAIGKSLITARQSLPRQEFVIGGRDPAAVERLHRLSAGATVPYPGHRGLRQYAGTQPKLESARLNDAARYPGHSALGAVRARAKGRDGGLQRRMVLTRIQSPQHRSSSGTCKEPQPLNPERLWNNRTYQRC